jgi:hypothetical protein
MQNALQGLVDAGVIKRNQPRASADPAAVSSIGERTTTINPDTPRSPNVSTNFR